MATKEAPIHQNVKEALINASELDTKLIMRSLRNTERVLNNKAVEEIVTTEKIRTKTKFSDIEEQVAGVYPKVMQDGEMDIGAGHVAWLLV